MDPEVIKIVLVGDEKCGKTTFLSCVAVIRLLIVPHESNTRLALLTHQTIECR